MNIQDPSGFTARIRLDHASLLVPIRSSPVYRRSRIASFRSAQVYIDGEVHAPGSQPVSDIPVTLFEAIGRAGGFTANADRSRMVLIRNGAQHLLDLTRMLAQNENPAKLVEQNGDLLRIASRVENGVYVMGEINRPLAAVPKTSTCG